MRMNCMERVPEVMAGEQTNTANRSNSNIPAFDAPPTVPIMVMN